MTTTTATISDAPLHFTTPCPQFLTVEWVAGTDQCYLVNERIAHIPGGATDLFEGIVDHFALYMLGPKGENLDAWREVFGSPCAFIPATVMTLGDVAYPRQPNLLRFWNGEMLIVEITSFDFGELLKLSHRMYAVAKSVGLKATSRGFGPRGLVTVFS